MLSLLIIICLAIVPYGLTEKLISINPNQNEIKLHKNLNEILRNIEIITDINEYAAENVNAQITQLNLAAPEINDYGQKLRYVLGSRVSGDRLVAQSSNSYKYPSAMDIQLKLSYPTSGIGAVVSYCEILVDQNSSLGRAYVISGGIGQRHITIVVEAKSVTTFAYNAAIYGY